MALDEVGEAAAEALAVVFGNTKKETMQRCNARMDKKRSCTLTPTVDCLLMGKRIAGRRGAHATSLIFFLWWKARLKYGQ